MRPPHLSHNLAIPGVMVIGAMACLALEMQSLANQRAAQAYADRRADEQLASAYRYLDASDTALKARAALRDARRSRTPLRWGN